MSLRSSCLGLIGALALVVILVGPVSAQAAQKVALVIGNGAYTGLPPLPNSLNDASDMAEKLRELGFDVLLERNADRAAMLDALARFGERLKGARVALVYFSGHGVQVDRKNLLVPTGAAIRTVEDVPAAAVSMDVISEMLTAGRRDFNFIILDACSDSRLEARDGRQPKGLARMAAPENTLIAYAADVDQLASGGWDRNSLYTGELLKHISVPGLRIEDIFQRTRERIVSVSRGEQRPVEFTALTKPFYFIPPPATPPGQAGRGPAEEAREPGEEFSDCDECPKLLVLPAGTFEMGSESSSREQPVHEVTIDLAFAIGKYEVTFDEWDACVAGGGCRAVPDDQGWERGRRPVINVTWDDAQAYARWLSGKTGRTYRLPSEAEWEYAARGGETTSYPWGSSLGVKMANCRDCGSQWSGSMTAPVGSFPPNPFQLHDMNGNVWEWVADCAHGSYKGAPNDGTAWITGICAKSLLRGGSFRDPGRVATSSFRAEAGPGQRREDFGFRVVRVIGQ